MPRPVLLLLAALLTTAEVPVPRAVAPYVTDGAFDPGDFGWMRGGFADAEASDRVEWAAVQGWLAACARSRRAAVEAELRAMGASLPPSRELLTEPLCGQVASATVRGLSAQRFADFARDLAVARPIGGAYLFAVRMAGEAAHHGSTLAETLTERPVEEQMLRRGWSWGQGGAAAAPPLTGPQRAIVLAMLASATVSIDAENTAWLKAIVAKEGWPGIARVGERASASAWLLVQHADADPAFQLRVLRLMEPMEARRDLPPRNFAYLYDRVMLRIAGRQRYGTQVTCRGGRRVPLPLEDERVDAWRAAATLEPLSDYLAGFDRSAGPCPPDPVGVTSASR